MRKNYRHIAALLLVQAICSASSSFTFEPVGASVPGKKQWRQYDINQDGQFDRSDIDGFIDRGGLNIETDLNGDGRKDVEDALALFLELSVMDRSCDRVVNDKDFEPVDTISIPEAPGISTVRRIVAECVMRAIPNLPPDIEQQAFRSVPQGKILSFDERVFVYQLAGMSGLAQQNLDAASWGYGRAFQTNERSAGAIGSLAFCLAVSDKDEEALLLLAYARSLFRESAPTATSLAWVLARHGQNEEALEYFREAVFYTPGIGQYHMNLGIMLLRMGMKREAFEEFRKASELDPEDAKKLLFWYTTKPPDEPPKKKPLDPEEFKQQIEVERKELEEQGFTEDEMLTPWDQMSPCEQARTIPELLERRYDEQMQNIAQSYSDDLSKRVEGVIMGFWPKWKNGPEDWNRYISGIPVVFKTATRMTFNAMTAAGHRRASLTRQMGSELLGYSSFFMDCALKEARISANEEINRWRDMPLTAESMAELRAEAYQDALEEAINYCYKSPVDQAYRWLTAEAIPYGLPNSKIEAIGPQDFLLLFMVIPLECFNIKDYCPDGEFGDTRKPEFPVEHTVGLDLFIVSIEWNTDNNEWEFNAGQGIIVGVTWKPETGFGFQLGAGVDFMGMEEAVYVRIDEGKLTVETEEGFGIGAGFLSAGFEVTTIQATAELY